MYKKSFLFIALVLIILSNTSVLATTFITPKSMSMPAKRAVSWTIHQEGEVLIANCDENTIVLSLTVIEIYSGKVAINANGCYQSKCSYDISNLPNGSYVASALFSDGTSATLVFAK